MKRVFPIRYYKGAIFQLFPKWITRFSFAFWKKIEGQTAPQSNNQFTLKIFSEFYLLEVIICIIFGWTSASLACEEQLIGALQLKSFHLWLYIFLSHNSLITILFINQWISELQSSCCLGCRSPESGSPRGDRLCRRLPCQSLAHSN